MENMLVFVFAVQEPLMASECCGWLWYSREDATESTKKACEWWGASVKEDDVALRSCSN